MKTIYFLSFIAIISFILLGLKENGSVEEPLKLKYNDAVSKLNKLNEKEKHIILNKGTEAPFSGEYNDFYENGIYICKQCNLPLFKSDSKFKSECGWPSFDDEIEGRVIRQLDADGRRVEILCAQCKGHLGHVFEGERLTAKNLRHCVNSASIEFIEADKANQYGKLNLKKAYFAGGCFWGVEHLMQNLIGVLEATSGYMGGNIENPSYQDVLSKHSGHLEAVEVIYNPDLIDYESLVKFFFEIHDPTQTDGQGPDIGPQYMSAIFYSNEKEKSVAEDAITELKKMGYKVITEVREKRPFFEAEQYHQNYYAKNGKVPYCHEYEAKF